MLSFFRQSELELTVTENRRGATDGRSKLRNIVSAKKEGRWQTGSARDL
jgi:hypothetical protein